MRKSTKAQVVRVLTAGGLRQLVQVVAGSPGAGVSLRWCEFPFTDAVYLYLTVAAEAGRQVFRLESQSTPPTSDLGELGRLLRPRLPEGDGRKLDKFLALGGGRSAPANAALRQGELF
jgi:hypothetical protein